MKKCIVILKSGFVVEIEAEYYEYLRDPSRLWFYKKDSWGCKETVAVFMVDDVAGFCNDSEV